MAPRHMALRIPTSPQLHCTNGTKLSVTIARHYVRLLNTAPTSHS
jgi:hypothetical protein